MNPTLKLALIKLVFAGLFLPWAALSLPAGLLLFLSVAELILRGSLQGLLYLGWAVAALAGAIGFVTWLFVRRELTRRWQIRIALLIVAGLCAAAPLIYKSSIKDESGLLWLLAGWLCAGQVALWLLIPAFPLNPHRTRAEPPFLPAPDEIRRHHEE